MLYYVPIMERIFLVIQTLLLVGASGMCSGLNVSLLSLKTNDLERKASLGNMDAKKVLPLRRNSHLTLVSLLFVNVAVVSATSLTLEHHMTGIVAGLVSTLLIVVFGEVLPQAWFSRIALRYCAVLAPVMRLMIVVTYPISKPLQLLLDKLVGPENKELHSRQELGLIISEHLGPGAVTELDEDEIEIMKSTLSLSEKRTKRIMTPIKNVYWLPEDIIIDATTIDEIKRRAWSRIPILSSDKTECRGILLMKDLVDIDFDNDPMPITDLPIHPTKVVGSMTALDTLFRRFIGAHSHLMPVERDGKIIGIVTIEDLIEEILGHEIEDESDTAGHPA